MLAGLAVAMPPGAIAVMLLREALLRGRRVALAAAAGVACVDTAYCALAVLAATPAAAVLSTWGAAPRRLAAATLIAVGLWQLRSLRRPSQAPVIAADTTAKRALARFLALTAVNPATVIFFLALATAVTAAGPAAKVAFVAGTGFASLSWQTGLVLVGCGVASVVSPRLIRWLTVLGSLIVLGLGLAMLAAAPP